MMAVIKNTSKLLPNNISNVEAGDIIRPRSVFLSFSSAIRHACTYAVTIEKVIFSGKKYISMELEPIRP